jgi:hypothetical protein
VAPALVRELGGAPSLFGNPATSSNERPVVLRPRLTAGLPFRSAHATARKRVYMLLTEQANTSTRPKENRPKVGTANTS